MKMVPFGKTDLHVSNLCLGTMQFGWTADEVGSCEVMDAFVEAGGNFIDTADIYSRWSPGNPGGVSEDLIGRWMKARGNRDDLIIATKVRGPMWDGPDGEGLSRSHVTRAVEDSLRRLQVDMIDLYQTHWPDEKTPMEETFGLFSELVTSGKVRHIGVSNYTTSQLSEAHALTPRFVSLQPHYNLVWREEYESRKMRFCDENDIAVIPYSPLEGGFLTGKYKRGEKPPKTPRSQGAKRFMTEDGFVVTEALEAIAAQKSVSVASVAIAWLLHRPTVVSPIIGANSPAQLADLLPAAELSLTEVDMRLLNDASEPFTQPKSP